jgi:putative ABC transport system substrate-binding protein
MAAWCPIALTTLRYAGTSRHIDKILNGAKPADLPIEVPTEFVLAVNVKTAKTLTLTIPPSIMASATKLVQ